MRILISMCILAGCLAAQDPAKTSPPPAVKQTNKTTAPAAPAIPKDAVQTAPGYYRWTDKDGKVWTYRQTPFGVKRWPAASEAQTIAANKPDGWEQRMTAVEEGDSVRFERTTPFGKRTWVRKKTDLTETERKVWDLQQKNSAANRTTEKE